MILLQSTINSIIFSIEDYTDVWYLLPCKMPNVFKTSKYINYPILSKQENKMATQTWSFVTLFINTCISVSFRYYLELSLEKKHGINSVHLISISLYHWNGLLFVLIEYISGGKIWNYNSRDHRNGGHVNYGQFDFS